MKYWLFIVSTILISACTRPARQDVDKLNIQSYAYHYRNIDSTLHLAQQAYQMAEGYDAGKAEALNNLAFVHIVKMEYDEAERLLQEVSAVQITGRFTSIANWQIWPCAGFMKSAICSHQRIPDCCYMLRRNMPS